jgi:taurine dioxygenase
MRASERLPDRDPRGVRSYMQRRPARDRSVRTRNQSVPGTPRERPYRRIYVRRLSGSLGAEIHGVDLTRELDEEAFYEIERAFEEHLFVAFRNQDISPEQHIAFARRFGPVMTDRFMKSPTGFPEIIEVVKEAHEKVAFGSVQWHSDNSFLDRPPMMSLLHAKELPPFGGDTEFSNQYLAYATLSEGLRGQLDRMTAVHTPEPYQRALKEEAFKDKVMQMHEEKDVRETLETNSRHPVVRIHPRTGKRSLYVNSTYVKRFSGWTEAESKPLLDYLFRHAVAPYFTCRFSWGPHDLLLWDNRCLQHIAIDDYDGYRRRMHRVTVEGDKPKGAFEICE